ncbi:MAG TPA: threonine/serine dehydratase [Thermoanaerobaculia bacterium]
MIGLPDIERARERIAPHVRRTPLLRAAPLRDSLGNLDLHLKLESLQVTGSFKARGAVNRVLAMPREQLAKGLVTASGGNHGLGVAYAGAVAGAAVTIYLPANAPREKAAKLARWGAEVVWEGELWDDSDLAARAAAAASGAAYVHSFSEPDVIAGQGTVGLEILEDFPDLDLLVVAIGGGGLISGVATAVKALRPGLRLVGVEPIGAPTLTESVKAGRVVELAKVETAANTLAPRKSEELNLEIVRRLVDEIVLVSDEEMTAAARWIWFETGIAAELSGAAAVAALRTGRVDPGSARRTAAIVCGAGTAGL